MQRPEVLNKVRCTARRHLIPIKPPNQVAIYPLDISCWRRFGQRFERKCGAHDLDPMPKPKLVLSCGHVQLRLSCLLSVISTGRNCCYLVL